jgi:tetratricopeptide (TPR) repeat protein
VRCRLGVALWQAGDTTAALDELEAALRLQPDLAEAHYRIGLVLSARKQPAAATTHLRRALELKPDWPEALAALGFTLATAPGEQDRDVVEGLRVASRAVELTSRTNFVALDALAAACGATGKYDEAARTAAKAAELAQAAGDKKCADQIQSRRKLYEAGQPYRE